MELAIKKCCHCIDWLIEWCKFNKVEITWSKTYIMILTNKKYVPFDSFVHRSIKIGVVSSFKLLGVLVDNKLTFTDHATKTCAQINNIRLKEFFIFLMQLKFNFFKTFILPYFDYCSTLLIYFNKSTIQKLCNKYYLSLYLLFKFDISLFKDFNDINKFLLDKFGIPAFQHRVFSRLSIFSFKILNFSMSPKVLREVILENFEKLNEPEASTSDKPESVRVLRNRKVIISPDTLITKYNSLTFSYFTYTFLNSISIEIYKLSFVKFLSFLKEETNNIYESIVMSFSKFNLTLKNYTWLKALS